MTANVLVVDDEQDFANLVTFHLRRHGYVALTANNGEEALDMARHHLPDLILLDLMLPKIDGLTVCELLRHHHPTRDIPILLITAQPGKLARYQGLAVGANQFLNKPISPSKLVQCVASALQANLKRPASSLQTGPRPTATGG